MGKNLKSFYWPALLPFVSAAVFPSLYFARIINDTYGLPVAASSSGETAYTIGCFSRPWSVYALLTRGGDALWLPTVSLLSFSLAILHSLVSFWPRDPKMLQNPIAAILFTALAAFFFIYSYRVSYSDIPSMVAVFPAF